MVFGLSLRKEYEATSNEWVQTMRFFLSKFRRSEDGAVTVDWVVMTAAVVGLAATGGASILAATNGLSGKIDTEVAAKSVDNGD